MSPNLKGIAKWVLGLIMSGVGIAMIALDAVVTGQGKLAIHTSNAVVALILVFVGGSIIDTGWAATTIGSLATAVGEFMKAKNG